DFYSVVNQLDQLACRAVQIRLLDTVSIERVKGYLRPFESSRIKHVELLLPYHKPFNNQLFIELKAFEPRLNRILIYASPKDRLITSNNMLGTGIIQFAKDIRTEMDEIIKLERFTTNIELFSEAQSHNAGLNRKVCIDRKGYIKNYLSHSKSFGDI